MTFPPRTGDLPLEEIKKQMDEFLQNGALVWIKWTCPKCGERAVSDDVNGIHLGGYQHTVKEDGTECGAVYDGKLFGLRVAFPLTTTETSDDRHPH